MPSRKVPFAVGEYYHIFNRGVAQMNVFHDSFDYKRFFKTMLYYQIEGPKPKFSIFSPTMQELNGSKIIEIVCYCLMPNHFHFLLKQARDGGITEFISKLTNSYTKYFNTKNERVGPLFQGEFKAVYVSSNEQLLHLSRYIHLNPIIGHAASELNSYRWSSYKEFLSDSNSVCDKRVLIENFSSEMTYESFVADQVSYAKELDHIKHLALD